MKGLYIILISKFRGQKTTGGQYRTTKTPLPIHFSSCFITFGIKKKRKELSNSFHWTNDT